MKPSLTPGQLFGLTKSLLSLARTYRCECRVPVPSLSGYGKGPNGANWRIDPPAPCERGCHLLIRLIAEDVASRYDMTEPGERRHPGKC